MVLCYFGETHSKANTEIVFSLCGFSFCFVWALLWVANRNSVHSNVEGNFYHICHPSMLVLYNYHLIKIPAFWQVCCALVNRWICERMIGSFTAIIAVYSCLPALLWQTCQSIILRSNFKCAIVCLLRAHSMLIILGFRWRDISWNLVDRLLTRMIFMSSLWTGLSSSYSNSDFL